MVNRKQLAKACEHLYRRSSGTTGRSGVYAELHEDVRSLMKLEAELAEGELPIVASVVDDGHWLLATTDRVAFRTGGEVISFPLSDVQDVHALALDDGNVDREDVLVLIADGQKHEVQIEAGYPMGGIWNVMRRLVRTWQAESGSGGNKGPTRAEP